MVDKKYIKGIAKYFDEMAPIYLNKFNNTIIKTILDECDIQENSTILETGSGTSDFTIHLLGRIGSRGTIICNDISKEMLKIAKNKVTDKRVFFLEGDISTISFEKYKVDKLICFNMFPHIVNKSLFYKNVYNNLYHGSELIICHDRSRKSIIEMHQRHKIPDSISYFPNLYEIVAELLALNFSLITAKNESIFYISVRKS
jgi:ubiquinone/menaquinone biosynthesis C-methylase UbiE